MSQENFARLWAQLVAANSAAATNNKSILKDSDTSTTSTIPTEQPSSVSPRGGSCSPHQHSSGTSSPPRSPPPTTQQPAAPPSAINCMEQFNHFWQLINRNGAQPNGIPNLFGNPLFPGMPTPGFGMNQQEVSPLLQGKNRI